VADIVFSNDERQGLSREDIELLHQHILQQIQTSTEIRDIITSKQLLDSFPRIKHILYDKVNPLRERLKRR
jgi:hypothetical protein